ncbi:EF-hand domain-containing protein [Sessilibacter sp. MAH2]
MSQKNNKWVYRITLSLATIAGLFSLTSHVSAEDSLTQQDHRWILAKYDLNGDDTITAEEITSKKHKVFQFMDADNSGSVSIDEYILSDTMRREALLRARFDKLDLDHDGTIDDAEYTSYLGLFASIDGDGDGNLTKSEVMASQAETVEYKTRCVWVLCLRTQSN